MGGNETPIVSAAAISSGVGAPAAPSPQIESTAPACTSPIGTSMRAPRRSTSRLANGAPAATPRAIAPATTPAVPNEPVSSRRKSSTARPLIANGSRVSSAPATSTATCGERRISA